MVYEFATLHCFPPVKSGRMPNGNLKVTKVIFMGIPKSLFSSS